MDAPFDSQDSAALAALIAPELDAAFRDAPRLDHDSAWFGHVPFAHWLIEAARPRLLVELGTHEGISYAALCDSVRRLQLETRCFAIDTWRGDDHAGHYPEATFSEFSVYHDRHFAAFSQLLRCTFDEGAGKFADGSVDLLHIDGLHTYEAVRHDWEAWRPKLSARAIVLFHDTTERRGDFGVWRLWAELAARWPGFEFPHAHGLGVLCVGAEAPAAVLGLTRLARDEAARVQARFAFLGGRWEAEWRAGAARRQLLVREAENRELEQQHGALADEIERLNERIRGMAAGAADAALALERAEARAGDGWSAATEALQVGKAADEMANRARRRVVELRRRLAHLRAVEARLHGAETGHATAVAERDWMLHSTSWRLTAPLRRLASVSPPGMRGHAKRAARLLWWAATPWRMPARLYWRRVRQQQAAESAPGPPATPSPPAGDLYEAWIGAFEPPDFPQIGNAPRPQISLLWPTAGADDRWQPTLDSIVAQTETHWTLLVPDFPEARQALASLVGNPRLVMVPCAHELGRDGVLAALLEAASDPWVCVLDSGDVLASRALRWVGAVLASEPAAAAVYGDEDRFGPGGKRADPLFKPGFAPEMLLAWNYWGRGTVLSRDLARQCGGFVDGNGAGAEWGLNLRVAAAALAAGRPVRRVTAVLCHRATGSDRDRPAPGTPAAAEHRDVLHAHLTAQGYHGVQVQTQPDGTQRSSWEIADPPLVSVIIPNHNGAGLLRRCLKGVLDQTAYRNIEVVVIENNSDDPETLAFYRELRRLDRVRIVGKPGPFNYSAVCNHGARAARGALLLFLNNDIEVQDPGWLGELVRIALLPGVGVVGTKLRYPDGTLQHAGVAAGPHIVGLMYWRAAEGEWGVFGSTDHLRNWSAVMGACQLVRRDAFDAVGGFDEAFRMANSDVVLAMRAARLGFRTAYTPFAALVHHEGASRGRQNPPEDMVRTIRELRRLGMEEDPFFHPGLSGRTSTPTLRAPGEPSCLQCLHDNAAMFTTLPPPSPVLDLFDDGAVLAAVGLPREHVLPSFSAAAPIKDEWDAARWIITLLRTRLDLRTRFPRALTAGRNGPFGTWLAEGAGGEMALPPGLSAQLEAMWALDPSAEPRRVYVWRDDVQADHPAASLPPGYAGFARFLFADLQFTSKLRQEEIWWFLLCNAEDPAAELVRLYRLNVAWQTAHPCGLTIFGRDAFAAWIADQFDVPAGTPWLDPAHWPGLPGPAEQVRLAYTAHPEWQDRFPGASGTPERAAALLGWLASEQACLPRTVRAWCAGQLAVGLPDELAAPAITVVGHFCYPSGLRVSVEAMCDAMELAGVAVSRRSIRTQPNDLPRQAEFAGLESGDITLVHTQPGTLFRKCYERANLAERRPRTYRIGYWYWELQEVPERWADMARHADEIWAATGFVADALRRVITDRPVHVMFPGVRIGRFTPRPREALGAPARGNGRFAFLFAFHMASITERKNPLGLIRAFRRAFTPAEPVDLVIKATSEERHMAEVAQLHAAAAGANITVIDRVFTAEETLALMDGCDAYVSLHRTEGLGLGMAEAMLLGKPVVATRYSGNLQFMDDSNSLLVDCAIVELARAVPPYDAGTSWAEPSEAHAAQLMRRLFDDQAAAAELGRRGQESVRTSMSLEAAGQRMAARLRAIAASRS